jgi:hypothetical protein
MAEGEWSDQQRDAVFLEHLENRRSELAVAGWQAPAITMVAQAFLLSFLASNVASNARLVALVAGILATLAAVISQLRLRAREEHYSEAIGFYAKQWGIRDPRPFNLQRDEPATRLLRAANSSWWPPIHVSWTIALLAFVVADFFAYCAA